MDSLSSSLSESDLDSEEDSTIAFLFFCVNFIFFFFIKYLELILIHYSDKISHTIYNIMPVGPLGENPGTSGGANLGSGPYNGYSPAQTLTNYKDGSQAATRRILRSSWNTLNATGNVNGYARVTTPFRAVNNSGDYLGRTNYVCGGPNQVNANKPGMKGIIGSIISGCDETDVPSSTCNVRWVADSSDYVKFKRQQAMNRNYNDSKNGGDESNGSYVALMAVRRS
jgi:hypothetical protein